nr:MAG: hypothetical protein [Microvirus sp.]
METIHIPEREIPMLSLTQGCASPKGMIVSRALKKLGDLLISWSMKIDGDGARKATINRRGLSLIHDIGLRRTFEELVINKPTTRQAILSRHYRSLLDSKHQQKFSFVSDEKLGVK